MNLELKEWNAFSEIDFQEEGIDKIKCSIGVQLNVMDESEVITSFTKDIDCIY